MTIAAFCGTFDPVTFGHIDVIERCSKIFDQVMVFVSINSQKNEQFSAEQRLRWLKESCAHLSNVRCEIQNGLAIDACKQVGATVLVRGVRNEVDCTYEQNMDYMNRQIDPEIETVCIFTKPEYMYCSSSNIREMMKYHLDFSAFVPECVYRDLREEK